MKELIYKDESYKIIGCCMEVHKTLGCGFFEAVYQEALEIEFNIQGIPYQREEELHIVYKNEILQKKYRADFICFDKIIVELKALSQLETFNEAQILNYLKVTEYKLALLVNFGETSLKYKRIVK